LSRWRPLNDPEAAQLAAELGRELVDGHPLHGREARVVARRDDCDDVAFEVEGAGLCVVHLTWTGPGDPRWPRFEIVVRLPEDD